MKEGGEEMNGVRKERRQVTKGRKESDERIKGRKEGRNGGRTNIMSVLMQAFVTWCAGEAMKIKEGRREGRKHK